MGDAVVIERTFIEQGMKHLALEEYLKEELYKAGFTGATMVKTPLVTRIIVSVTRPSLAIGKSGQNIRNITETIERKFKVENPQIEIKLVEVPELCAMAMANRLKSSFERGYAWRGVVYKTVRSIMEAGAQGVEIRISGKLAGKGGRKKRHRFVEGYMKKVGEQARLVDYAKATAYPKSGAIGIKVRIVGPGTIFPDKVGVEVAAKLKEEVVAMEEAAKGEKVAEGPEGVKEITMSEALEKSAVPEERAKEPPTLEKKSVEKQLSSVKVKEKVAGKKPEAIAAAGQKKKKGRQAGQEKEKQTQQGAKSRPQRSSGREDEK